MAKILYNDDGSVKSVTGKVPTSEQSIAAVNQFNQQQQASSPVGIISTEGAKDTLQKNLNTLNQASPTTAPNYVAPPAPTNPTPPQKAYFENSSGQQAEYTQEQLDDKKTQKYLRDNGFVMSKTEGPKYDPAESVRSDVGGINARIEELTNDFDAYNVDEDPYFLEKKATITANYDKLRKQTEDKNFQRAQSLKALGARLGTSQYAGAVQSGIEGEELNQANERLADIDREQAEAIAAARNAYKEGKFTEFNNKIKNLQTLRDQKQKTLDEYNDTLANITESARKETADMRKTFDDLIMDVKKNGAPNDVIDAINATTSLSDAVKAAGDYLQSGTGIIGEYNFYKRQEEAAGRVPMSFDEYQTRDANRKVSLARAATVNGAGLTPQQNATFLRITDSYQRDPSVRVLDKAQSTIDIANQVIANPASSSNQLKALYTLVKALDPDSAVREGEIGLAQQTNSYLSKYGTTLTRVYEGRVIPPETAIELAKATKDLVNTWKSAAKHAEKKYRSQAMNSDPAVGGAFDKYIKDFETTPSTSDEAIGEENDAEEQLSTLLQDPEKSGEISQKLSEFESSLGRGVNATEFFQAFPEYMTQ